MLSNSTHGELANIPTIFDYAVVNYSRIVLEQIIHKLESHQLGNGMWCSISLAFSPPRLRDLVAEELSR